MYNIFYNDRLLIIQSHGTPLLNADLVLNLDGSESREVIQSIITAFEANSRTSCLCLRSSNIEATWSAYSSLYKIVEAAGGVVFNDSGKVLLIFRKNKWDLPKGKLDNGEDPESGAVREVQEECGVKDLTITGPLPAGYHTYTQNGKNILKKTYWYQMQTSYKGNLVPQLEEDITDVVWMTRKELIPAMENAWASVRFLLKSNVIESDLIR